MRSSALPQSWSPVTEAGTNPPPAHAASAAAHAGGSSPAALAATLPQAVWRADRLGQAPVAGLPTGFARLDAELPGGGWPPGTLTELISRDPGAGELRLLVPTLQRLTRERRVVILLAPPHVPYAPALAEHGIDLDWLLVVQASHAADRLWAIEQTLRSSAFGALLAWLPTDRTRPEHLRRLQLAAAGTRGPAFLLRGLPAQFESSPAPLRLLLQPRPAQQLSVTLLKRRGPVLAKPLMLDLPQPAGTVRLRHPAQALQPRRLGDPAQPVDGYPTLAHAHRVPALHAQARSVACGQPAPRGPVH